MQRRGKEMEVWIASSARQTKASCFLSPASERHPKSGESCHECGMHAGGSSCFVDGAAMSVLSCSASKNVLLFVVRSVCCQKLTSKPACLPRPKRMVSRTLIGACGSISTMTWYHMTMPSGEKIAQPAVWRKTRLNFSSPEGQASM